MRSLAVLLMLLLAGCSGSVPTPSAPVEPPSLPEPSRLSLDLADCHAQVVFFFTEFSAVEPFLPAGFYPRDAGDMLPNVEQAIGRAGLVVTLDVCQRSDLQEEPVRFFDVVILVERPHVDGVDDAAQFDAYLLERLATAGAFHDAAHQAGVPVRAATEISARSDLEVGGLGLERVEGEVRDGGGSVLAIHGGMVAPEEFGAGAVRYWHVDGNGTTYVDQDLTLDARVGHGTCEYREDSLLGDVLGPTTSGQCDPSSMLMATFPSFDLSTVVTRLPGVRPG